MKKQIRAKFQTIEATTDGRILRLHCSGAKGQLCIFVAHIQPQMSTAEANALCKKCKDHTPSRNSALSVLAGDWNFTTADEGHYRVESDSTLYERSFFRGEASFHLRFALALK